jgi:hypothetical protein
MRKQLLSRVLTLTCLLGLGLGAQAEGNGKVVTNVPFEFSAGGATLPAGIYTVDRVTTPSDSHLIIRNRENGVFLLPVTFDGASVEGALFTFQHVGNKYFLSKVKTPAGVYTIGTPRALTTEAQKKTTDGLSSSGTN